MNTSSNLLVLGVTGQVGKLVAKNLRRKYAGLSVGTRRKANLEELADQFGHHASSISMIHEPSMRH